MLETNRRTAFSTLWAMDAMNPSQSTFHNPLSRDLAHSSQSRDAKIPLTMVRRQWSDAASLLSHRRELFPLLGFKVQRVIDGEPQVPAFLPWRETLFFDGASLAILLTGHVLVAGAAAVIASPLQHFPLGTDHMVSPVLKASSGHHVRFLPGMDGNIGRDAPFLQNLSQPSRIVGGVGCQRDRRQGEMVKQTWQGLPFPF